MLLLINCTVMVYSYGQGDRSESINYTDKNNSFDLIHYNTGWIYETHNPVCPETVPISGSCYYYTPPNSEEKVVIFSFTSKQQNTDGSPFYSLVSWIPASQLQTGAHIEYKDVMDELNSGINALELNGGCAKFLSYRDKQYAISLWSNWHDGEGVAAGEIYIQSIKDNIVSGTFNVTLWADAYNFDKTKYVKIEKGKFSVPLVEK